MARDVRSSRVDRGDTILMPPVGKYDEISGHIAVSVPIATACPSAVQVSMAGPTSDSQTHRAVAAPSSLSCPRFLHGDGDRLRCT